MSKTDPTLAEMAIRVARAEMERDAAVEREAQAQEQAREAWRAYSALTNGDKERILDTLHIIGIPARDLADIYEIEQTWRREGGSDKLLEWWRKQRNADPRRRPLRTKSPKLPDADAEDRSISGRTI